MLLPTLQFFIIDCVICKTRRENTRKRELTAFCIAILSTTYIACPLIMSQRRPSVHMYSALDVELQQSSTTVFVKDMNIHEEQIWT
jgi:hypothetical protein